MCKAIIISDIYLTDCLLLLVLTRRMTSFKLTENQQSGG